MQLQGVLANTGYGHLFGANQSFLPNILLQCLLALARSIYATLRAPRVLRSLVFVVFNCFFVQRGEAALPATVGWYAIPNSKLNTVCPPNGFGGSPYSFTSMCGAVVSAWNSGVMDTTRNRLIVWGGGHNDYYGNELYAVNLNDLTIQRLNNPTVPTNEGQPCAGTLGGVANSRHTNDGIAYMPNLDKMFVFGGVPACALGGFTNDTWMFDFATLTWQAKNPTGVIPNKAAGVVTAYDPNTNKIYLHDDISFYAYDHVANSYQQLATNNGIDYHMTAVLDPVRKKFVIIGGGQAWVYSVAPNSTYTRQALVTTGGSSIVNSYFPGLAYDPVSDRIVAWSGGDTVYSLNMDTNIWTATTYAGGPGAAQVNGTYKRWSYSPASGVFVLVNAMNQNAYVLRAGAPAVDTTPDAFSFTSQSGVAQNAVMTSNTITPTGFNTAAAISVAGGSYSINGGAFVTTAGTLSFGQTVAVRQTSSSALGTTTSATLTVGGVAASFAVTTLASVDTTPDVFAFAPQTSVALNTVITSNAIVPTGYNTAASISVSAGSSYSINGGAFVTTAGTIAPGQTVAVRQTSSVNNSTQTCSTVTIGGIAGQFCSTTVAPGGSISLGGQDYATRCAQAGVVKCVGFDTAADFNIGPGGTGGAYGLNSGILPPSGTSDYTRAVQDGTIKASGAGSLRFTIPSNSGSSGSGAYFTNFSTDLSTQFGAGESFYVQWRQRFSPEFLNTVYAGGGGWKQAIIGTGDQPGTIFSSCSDLELPVQNTNQRGFPQLYNSCSGSASHGPYDGFYEPYGAFDFKLQNARPSPYCLYSQSSTGYFPPNGNCFRYVADEWMTFQLKVQLGPRVGDEFQGSYVTLWGAREGQASEMLIQWGPYNLTAGSSATNQRYGKVWLLPYHTGKDATQVHPTAYTWYDELIVSRNKIEDPPITQTSVDTTPDAFGFTAQTGVAQSVVLTSNTITPSGFNTPATISVSAGGSYSINGGAFVTTAGTLSPGQTVAVRQTSSSALSTTTTLTLTIGGVAGAFAVTTQSAAVDTTPDAFSFVTQTGVATNAVLTSSSITPTGFNAAAAISVSAGGSYSINGGAFVTTAGTLSPGQTVAVRQTSSSALSTTTTVTVTIGGVAGAFAVTTQSTSVDTTPNAFSFATQTGVALGSITTSNTVTPTGFNAAAAISVSSGASYSINGGTYLSSAGTLSPGQSVTVRQTASTLASTTTTATLTIGGVAGTFAITTAAPLPDTTPDAFGFAAQAGVATNAVTTSNSIVPAGFNAASAISVSAGGSYSINGGAYVSTAGTISPGQSVAVRQISSSALSATKVVSLTIGGVSGTFSVTTGSRMSKAKSLVNFALAPAPTVSLVATPTNISNGATSTLTWSSPDATSCLASGGWSGSRATSGSLATSALNTTTNFVLTCSGAGGDTSVSATVTVGAAATPGLTYGLEWPGTGAVRRMLYWHNPFPIYDATYVFKVYPRKKTVPQSPNTYYTTFFWGNDGEASWYDYNGQGGMIANTYYGAHPYPVPAPNGPGQWEIAVYGNDYVTGSEVVWDRWYTQAFRAWRESPSITHHEFYYDLPDLTKVIRRTITDPNWANVNPPTPAIVIGQAPNPWGGYPGWEEFNGVIRGIQIYSGLLSVNDILSEIATPKSTAAGTNLMWYLNVNPRPNDVTDKKGIGTPNNPSWNGATAFEWVQ